MVQKNYRFNTYKSLIIKKDYQLTAVAATSAADLVFNKKTVVIW